MQKSASKQRSVIKQRKNEALVTLPWRSTVPPFCVVCYICCLMLTVFILTLEKKESTLPPMLINLLKIWIYALFINTLGTRVNFRQPKCASQPHFDLLSSCNKIFPSTTYRCCSIDSAYLWKRIRDSCPSTRMTRVSESSAQCPLQGEEKDKESTHPRPC